MSVRVQFRKGTSAEHDAFVGSLAELTVDTTKKTLVVHDGTTVGGHPLAKEEHGHGAVDIVQDATHRFVTDDEKDAWNQGSSLTIATSSSNGLMSSFDKVKVDGIESGANNYIHPENHPASIITQDSNNRLVTDAEKSSWNNKSDLSLGEVSSSAYRGDRGKLAYDHSQSAHAPVNSQKNSDITKAEIENKLTGNINTHSHPLFVGNGISQVMSVNTDERLDIVAGANVNIAYSDVNNSLTISTTGTLTGNADTATKLAIPVKINDVDFDGSANIIINAVDSTPRVAVSEKGIANGVATLDVNGKLTLSQIPEVTDDIVEYVDFATFPATGESGKFYIALDNNKAYRWNGSSYVLISGEITKSAVEAVLIGEISSHTHGPDLILGELSTNAYRGDRGKLAYDHSLIAHAPSDAQKNSDITKAEIEAKLIGTVSSHDHDPQVVYATQEEVDLGVNETKVVTPKTLVTHIGIDTNLNVDTYVDSLITQTGAEPDANIIYAKNFPANITVAEVQALDGITGNIQAQINNISLSALTKENIESVLTGEISTHSHAQIQLKTINGETIIGSGDIEISSGPMLSNPGTIYVTQEKTLTITNYDGFSTYSVLATTGTASITGDTITYTAPSTAGTDTLTVTVNDIGRNILLTINAAAVVKPNIIGPINNSIDIGETPTISSSEFQTIGLSDTHVASKCIIMEGAAVIHESGELSPVTMYTVPAGILQVSKTYSVSFSHKGNVLGWSEYSDKLYFTTKSAFANIIGLVLSQEGGGSGTWTRIDSNFNQFTPDGSYFSNHAVYSGIVPQTIDGQSMIKIPKFYFKGGVVPSGTYAGKTFWMISDQPASGFTTYPLFITNTPEVELSMAWVGAYQASDGGSSKMASTSGATPLGSIDFATMKTRAENRNVSGVTGFSMWNVYAVHAIQILCSIEIGGANSQTLIAAGFTNGSSVASVSDSTVATASWRGIVGLWGNVWQMFDGLKRNGGYWHAHIPGTKTYTNTNIQCLTESGWIVNYDINALQNLGLLIPGSVNSTESNSSVGDYFYSNTSVDDRICYHGGLYGYGSNAGLFGLYARHDPSNAHSSFGSRLAKV